MDNARAARRICFGETVMVIMDNIQKKVHGQAGQPWLALQDHCFRAHRDREGGERVFGRLQNKLKSLALSIIFYFIGREDLTNGDISHDKPAKDRVESTDKVMTVQDNITSMAGEISVFMVIAVVIVVAVWIL